ncbi:MAG: acyl dehydratase [Deltaproteobacteria bacterium]|nr:acyl dehydratase [Deltaproteobacteria bacterium]
MDYFEDIEIGSEREIGRHTPSRKEIISFAKQWDPQPFHVDEGAARLSLFGGLSASSCHTYSITSLIFSRSDEKLKTSAMLGLEMQFPTPVRPDEELTMLETYLEKRESRSRPGLGIVKSRSILRNPRGEEVMRMQSTFMVERRGG